jgi:proline iminopeptidase
LEIIPDAGHSATEPGITDALVRAADAMAERHIR